MSEEKPQADAAQAAGQPAGGTDQQDPVDTRLDDAFEQLEKQSSAGTPAASSSSASGILALLIAFIALGVASYSAWELYRQASQPVSTVAAPDLSALESRVTGLQSRLDHLESSTTATDMAQVTARLDALAESRQQSEAAMATQLQDLRERLGTTSRDWIHAEVEYLVRMAVQRVLMEQDAGSAIELLESADRILRDTEGLTAHTLREALRSDIAKLKAVNVPDTQGTYLALSALVAQVPTLKRELPVFTPDAAPKLPPPGDSLLARVLAAGQKAISRLASLVDFRRNQVEVKPILPPHEAYFLRQNLVLKLQLAQIALLEGNQAIYDSAIAEAGEWVSQGFEADDAATLAMLNELSRLSTLPVSAELPDISGSLRAVRVVMGEFGSESAQEAMQEASP